MTRYVSVLACCLLLACSRGALSDSQQDNLSKTIDEMMAVAAVAGGITDGYSAVWSAAIQGGADFGDRLREHRDSAELKAEIVKLGQQFNSLEARIKTLRASGVPDPLFRELGDAYELLSRLRALATVPTGSLQSFNANTAELASRVIGSVSRLRLYLPVVAAAGAK